MLQVNFLWYMTIEIVENIGFKLDDGNMKYLLEKLEPVLRVFTQQHFPFLSILSFYIIVYTNFDFPTSESH